MENILLLEEGYAIQVVVGGCKIHQQYIYHGGETNHNDLNIIYITKFLSCPYCSHELSYECPGSLLFQRLAYEKCLRDNMLHSMTKVLCGDVSSPRADYLGNLTLT